VLLSTLCACPRGLRDHYARHHIKPSASIPSERRRGAHDLGPGA